MASIFQKIRTITLGNVHTLLDKVGELNTVGQVEQHVRDLEDARKDLEGSLAEARYDLRTRANNLTTHQIHAGQLEGNIRTLMAAGGDQNVTSARLLAIELGTLRKTIEAEEPGVPEQQGVVDKLSQAVAAINGEEQAAKGKLGTLRSQVATSRAKDRAATALEQVGTAMANGGAIDSAMDRLIWARNPLSHARSDAAFERALGGLPVSNADADADAILAELTQPKTAA